jgi:hypothetical protein
MADSRVRLEDSTWNRSIRWPAARQNCSLHLLRLGRARIPDILLLSHAARELRSPASSSDAARHHIGGDLRPPLRDARGRTVVGETVPALLCTVSLREKLKPPRATTSSIGASLWPRTSPPSAPASETIGRTIGWLYRPKSTTS